MLALDINGKDVCLLSTLGKLRWYWNRFSLMSFAEVFYRLQNKLIAIVEKLEYDFVPHSAIHWKGLGAYFFNSTDLQEIREVYNRNLAWKTRLVDHANQILAHQFTFFGLNPTHLGDTINWHQDYVNGKSSPKRYYTSLNYRDYHQWGDAKYIWELSRFPHFFTLANAYIVTEEAKYAEEILSQLNHWIDENPYLIGIHWTSSLEHTFRLTAWAWALKALEVMNYPIPDILKRKIATSVFQQTRYIRRHISNHSSANNHRIGEFLGMMISGLVFNPGADGRQWAQQAQLGLIHELEKQVYKDGLDKEHAFTYHCSVAEFYVVASRLWQIHNLSPPAWVSKRIESMVEVIQYFRDQGNNLIRIGDSDDALLLHLGSGTIEELLTFLLNSGALLFQRGDFKYQTDGQLDEASLWLLGPKAVKGYESLITEAPDYNTRYLKDAGYVIFRSPDTHAVMDVAPLGFLSIAAHGHADALALTLSYQGKPFLVDPGTYGYYTAAQWRDYFRSTQAHNTVCIDGQNQSRIGGMFMWMEKAEPHISQVSLDSPYQLVAASHNGYQKQGIGVRHERQTLFIPGVGFAVLDILHNLDKRAHTYSQHWHLHPDCQISQTDREYLIVNGDVGIRMLCPPPVEDDSFQVISGETDPISGWYSSGYGKKTPTSVIQRSCRTQNSVHWLTLWTLGTTQWKLEKSSNEWILQSKDRLIQLEAAPFLTAHASVLSN